MKNTIILLVLFISIASFAQKITGDKLLEKSINFHDPTGNWETFHGELVVIMETPEGTPRKSKIKINHPSQYFSVETARDSIVTKQIVNKEVCSFAINGNTNLSEELIKKYSLNCKRARLQFKLYFFINSSDRFVFPLMAKLQTSLFTICFVTILSLAVSTEKYCDGWFIFILLFLGVPSGVSIITTSSP